MKIKFNSQVFIGNRRVNIVLRILGLLIGAILIGMVGIKVLVGDFDISDISGIIVAMIIISVCNKNSKQKPQYVSTLGNVEFEQEKMKITYTDIDDGKKLGLYSESSTIWYDEIESIEYGRDLNCFRIVANCLKVRDYIQFHNEKIINSGEDKIETFMYIMDPNVAVDIQHNFEKYTGIKVTIL